MYHLIPLRNIQNCWFNRKQPKMWPQEMQNENQFFFSVFVLLIKSRSQHLKIGPCCLTAPFNKVQTLKFKAQPTNAFFSTVNEMFGGCSQLPTTAERMVHLIKSSNTIYTTGQCSAVVGSWEEPPNILLTVAEKAFVGWAFNFGVRLLLKFAVIAKWTKWSWVVYGVC